jgi:hypothetical protein
MTQAATSIREYSVRFCRTWVGLIFFYAWRMNKLDAEHGVEE